MRNMDSHFEKLLEHEDYALRINGVEIRVRNRVFSPDPALTNSTSIVLSHMPDLKDKVIADMGCGTGIISIVAALNGVRQVIAIDVSNEALQNAQENINSHQLTSVINLRRSDLFELVPEKFDYIFGNLPILDEVWSKQEGSNAHLMQRFIKEAKDHLRDNGSIYIPWGSFVDISPLKSYLEQTRLVVRELQEDILGYTWYLLEISNP
jgi:16S rRNA G1207 methylase RsmC